jgi:XisI protein
LESRRCSRLSSAHGRSRHHDVLRRGKRDHVIAEGWDGEERVHFIVAHLEIIDGKIWIQADNTDVVIARELEAAGVPKTDIVLGFRPPSIRPLTEYAAA